MLESLLLTLWLMSASMPEGCAVTGTVQPSGLEADMSESVRSTLSNMNHLPPVSPVRPHGKRSS